MLKKYPFISLISAVVIGIMAVPVFSQYTEGIDTTLSSGYSHDGLFHVSDNMVVTDPSNEIAIYNMGPNANPGFFSYAFDDIKKPPDTFRQCKINSVPMGCCYVIHARQTNAYYKIALLSTLADGSYIYRYGRTVSGSKPLFAAPNYDPNIRYKPNNLYLSVRYVMPQNLLTLVWEPPLVSNNHLIGYRCFISKSNAVIDTSKPINLSQWDSTDITTTTRLVDIFFITYVNIAAVYQEGRSDFIKGWVESPRYIGVRQQLSSINKSGLHAASVKRTAAGYCFSFPGLPANIRPLSAAIYSPSGRLIARISTMQQGNRLIWNAVKNPKGMFIAKVAFSDGSVGEKEFVGGE
jgi:hypothetical protein